MSPICRSAVPVHLKIYLKNGSKTVFTIVRIIIIAERNQVDEIFYYKICVYGVKLAIWQNPSQNHIIMWIIFQQQIPDLAIYILIKHEIVK